MDKGLFGGVFDFNGDGKLDAVERAAEFMAFVDLMSVTDDGELCNANADWCGESKCDFEN